MAPITPDVSRPRAFGADTAVAVGDDGVVTAELSDRWDRLGGGPLGGYSLALALRALGLATSFPDPLTVSATFVRPAEHGPAGITTEIVRKGRTVATISGRLRQAGSERLRLTATFADRGRADDPTMQFGEPPAMPEPDDCVDPFTAMRPTGTVADRVDYRFGRTPGWLQGAPTGDPTIEGWIRFADAGGGSETTTVDGVGLALLVDAVPPAVLELGATGSSTIELTVHLRARPAPGWLAFRASTRSVTGGYHDEDLDLWDSTGTLVAQSRQLARVTGLV